MHEKIKELLLRFGEAEKQLSDPAIMQDKERYKELSRDYAHLSRVKESYELYRSLDRQKQESRDLIREEQDPELRALAEEELEALSRELTKEENSLKLLLIPPDPLDGKNIIMEIRAGTGGDEAGLFAADLYRMYTHYADSQKWSYEIISVNAMESGGFKEMIFSVSGKNVYGRLRRESGTHRVQRIPLTESGGRIHTSAATVAVLPEAEETDIKIRQEDLRIDVFRSSGPGGQSVNTTDSAVRITHIPTGLVVSQQDEKSQIKNRAKALRVLRSRLYEREERKNREERARHRKDQVGSGDRSERIRTYNFPQNRVTDHRINLTLYRLEAVMTGALDELIEALLLNANEEALKEA